MNSFSDMLPYLGRVALVGCAGLLLSGCFQTNSDMAGIDGSGAPVEPIAEDGFEPIYPTPSSVSVSSTPAEPPPTTSSSAAPPLPPLTGIVAHGTINGFGSVIVRGVRYDTSNTQYFRNSEPAVESDFEVGDLITVKGFEQNGVHYAQEVHFQPVISGVVENYDYNAGVITMLGQRISLDASTVIDPILDERHLRGRDVSISGYVADAEVTATRITQNEVGGSEITGHIGFFDPSLECFPVGAVDVCYGALATPLPALNQGDLVHVVGQSILEEEGGRYFEASAITKLDLSELQAGAGSVLLSGVIRNLETASRFWVNSVEIIVNQDTQVANGQLIDLMSGFQVVVKGSRLEGDTSLLAEEIDIINPALEQGFVGQITHLENIQVNDTPAANIQAVFVAGQRFKVIPSTAIADVRMVHSRLTFTGLGLGDYVVAEAAMRNGEYTATAIKRTSANDNNRTYTFVDEPEYQWGFTPQPVNPADAYENVLGASGFDSVLPTGNKLRTASGLVLKMRPITRVSVSDGRMLSTAQALQLLSNREANGRATWLNYQVDARIDNIWIDQLHIILNGDGDQVDIPIP